MYISHLQFKYRLKQFYLSEDLLRSLRLICLSQSYLRSSLTTPILWNKGPCLLWAQHQSWSQSPSEHPTTSDTSENPTTPNIRTTPKSRSSMNLTIDIHHHYTRDQVLTGNIKLHYIATLDNPADILMKALSPHKHVYLLDALRVKRAWRGMLLYFDYYPENTLKTSQNS